MQKFLLRLKGPSISSHNPLDGLSVQPSNWCTDEPHQRPKQKNHHTCKHGLRIHFTFHVENCDVSQSLEQRWKTKVSRQTVQRGLKWNGEASHSGKQFNQNDRLCETREKAICSTLLRRSLLGIKIVNSEIKSNDPTSYLERCAPRGSRHLVEPTWVTHLLRTAIANSVVECILRAKTLPLNLAGTGSEGTRKVSRSCHRHSQCWCQIETVGKKRIVMPVLGFAGRH